MMRFYFSLFLFLGFFLFQTGQAHALTCVPQVAQWGTITYINSNQLSCAAADWAVFNASELAAYVAASSSASGVPPVQTALTAISIPPEINSQEIAFVFGWGFGAIVLFYFLGYGVSIAISMIRKA